MVEWKRKVSTGHPSGRARDGGRAVYILFGVGREPQQINVSAFGTSPNSPVLSLLARSLMAPDLLHCAQRINCRAHGGLGLLRCVA